MSVPHAREPGSVESGRVEPGSASPRRVGRRIGEAARLIGVSPSALRLWERQGLVSPGRTTGRYRLYTDADLERLAQVRRMRQVERVNAPGIRRVLGSAGSAHDSAVDGRLLHDLRTARGLSLRGAAERAGLSTSLVGAIERGVAGASISSLQRLTSAYGTTVAELIGRPRRHARVTRAGRRPRLALADEAICIEQLAADASLLEPQLFHLAPGASSDGAYAHAGEEFLFVLSGALTVWVGEHERYRLADGDALLFPSTLPHRWRNAASRETRLLWINTPPTF